MTTSSPDLIRQVEAESESIEKDRKFARLLGAYADATCHGSNGSALDHLIAHIDSIITARVAAARQGDDESTRQAVERAVRDTINARVRIAVAEALAASQAAPACAIPDHWRERAEWIANGTNLGKDERGNLAVMLLRTLLKAPQAAPAKVEGSTYSTGDPTKTGVYACRVPMDFAPTMHEDKFLMWIDGEWAHLGSDQRYRGAVSAWLGPLPRRFAPSTPAKEPT